MLNGRHKEFIKLIEGAARSRSVVDVFGDAVHLMAQSLWKLRTMCECVEVQRVDWVLRILRGVRRTRGR